MTNLFPTYPTGMMRPVKGQGSWIWDDQGNKYIDLTSGIGVCQLGHGPEQVKAAVVEQLDKLWHTSNLFEIEPQVELAELLAKISGLDYVFFANSGAEANEAAIKLARRYHQKVRGDFRFEIITFQKSFHGRTLATLTATGQEKVKEGFSPLPAGFKTIPYGDIASLKEAFSEKTAAVMLEVIQGEGGVYPADPNWLIEVERLAREKDVLIIIDEVQTGIGRTGKWFGFQHYQMKPDIITLAKGLGSGFPIGAMLGTDKLKEAFSLGSHGSTFGGNYIVTTAGLATIQAIAKKNILEQVQELGEYVKETLQNKLSVYPQFVEIRGKGLMIGIEWSQPVSDLIQIAKENKVLVLSAGPNVLRLLPPLNITMKELEEGLKRIELSVKEWLEQQ